MKYIIDDKLLFDSDAKKISALSRPDVLVPLTTTASRLLEEMVLHPHQVLLRSYLLKKVWEDKGYAASDASLNNNISQIRKYFSALSDSDIDLRTIPKTGFQLNVIVRCMSDDSNSNYNFTDVVTDDAEVTKGYLSSKIVYAAVSIIALTCIIISLLFQGGGVYFSEKKTAESGVYEKCTFFNLDKVSLDIKGVIDLFPYIKDKCKVSRSHVYYDLSSLRKDRAKTPYVSICEFNEKKGYEKCENIKHYYH